MLKEDQNMNTKMIDYILKFISDQFKQSKTDSQHKKKSSKGVLEGEFHEIDKKDL